MPRPLKSAAYSRMRRRQRAAAGRRRRRSRGTSRPPAAMGGEDVAPDDGLGRGRSGAATPALRRCGEAPADRTSAPPGPASRLGTTTRSAADGRRRATIVAHAIATMKQPRARRAARAPDQRVDGAVRRRPRRPAHGDPGRTFGSAGRSRRPRPRSRRAAGGARRRGRSRRRRRATARRRRRGSGRASRASRRSRRRRGTGTAASPPASTSSRSTPRPASRSSIQRTGHVAARPARLRFRPAKGSGTAPARVTKSGRIAGSAQEVGCRAERRASA